MKLKFIALGGILSISSIGFVMDSKTVQMPDAQTLQARLSKHGFDHFAEKTECVKNLANQQKDPLDIARAIELCLYDYNEYLKSKGTPDPVRKIIMTTMKMKKPRLFKAFLENEQEALKELKDHGLYKPIE